MAKCLSIIQLRSKRLKVIWLLSSLLVNFTLPSFTYAWTTRGHYLVCEAAIHLVQNKELKTYLMNRIQAITYLCNTPDIYWKGLKGSESSFGTHFFEPDLIGMNFDEIPLKYSDFEKLAIGKKNLLKGTPIRSPAYEIGSSWWRADQFVRLAIEAGKKAASKETPDFEDEDFYSMWVMMGLLGHFIGDNAQPFHTISDYDGWQKGHGGIHIYYESDLVNELPHDIMSSIIKQSPSAFKELQLNQERSTIENMKRLTKLSFQDVNALLALDPVVEKSVLRQERGMELKTEAKRKPASDTLSKFKPLLVKHLARGATLLAYQWEQIYRQAGKPPVAKDKSYQKFPHQFQFIPPDYAENKY